MSAHLAFGTLSLREVVQATRQRQAELPPGDDGKPFLIKVGKLRGVESFGMLCSARELGLSTDHAGLLELADDAPLPEVLHHPVVRAFFQALAACSRTSGLIQMFDSTSIRAHVSAAGAKGGRKIRRLDAHVAGSARESTSRSTATAIHSTFI